MSSSSAERPTLSIVVGSNGAPASVEVCLAALEPQVDGAEVLVCEPAASPPDVRERFPFARFGLINVRDPKAGRDFVEGLRDRVTTAVRWPSRRKKDLAPGRLQIERP